MTIYLFLIILIVNYLMTFDAFSENKIVYLDPNKVCKEFVFEFSQCITNKKEMLVTANNTFNETYSSEEINCNLENEKLIYCFDNLKSFNRRCEIYLSEYYLCKRDSVKSDSNLCGEILNDIKTCNIWPEYIKINSTLLETTY